MTGEQGSCAKVGLFPALSSVSVASMLQLTDDFTIAIQYRHRKRIATLMRGTRGISVPPVIDCEPGNAMRNGEVLRQCIITTTVATEVGTVLSRVWVGRVNQLIAVGRRFLPWVSTLLEAAVLNKRTGRRRRRSVS